MLHICSSIPYSGLHFNIISSWSNTAKTQITLALLLLPRHAKFFTHANNSSIWSSNCFSFKSVWMIARLLMHCLPDWIPYNSLSTSFTTLIQVTYDFYDGLLFFTRNKIAVSVSALVIIFKMTAVCSVICNYTFMLSRQEYSKIWLVPWKRTGKFSVHLN